MTGRPRRVPPPEFPPHVLREYALISDGERGALCGPRGDLVWLCFPRWHDPAVLANLIGGEGVYAVTPVGRFVWGGHYEEGSLIWRNRWITTEALVECRDALAFPGDPKRAVLLRRLCVLEGTATVRVVLDVRAGFGRSAMREVARDEDGRWTARSGSVRLRWSGAPRTAARGDRFEFELALATGERHDLVLELAAGPLGDLDDPDAMWEGTENAWRQAIPSLVASASPRDARHSFAVLRGLTSRTGGMVAAATTSLPERAGAGHNYDYRYAWIRDQCYAGLAVAADGPHELLTDTLRFVTERLLADGPALKPAYLVDGGRVPDQRQLSLPGYPGGRDITGNWVNQQFQLDAVGEVLELLAAAARHDLIDVEGWRAMALATDIVESRWERPDAGMWELDNAWWTHSRLACVAGLRTAAEVAPPADAARMAALADAVLAGTAARCLHPSGRWMRTPEIAGVDAALVLPPVRGALPASDPRTVGTLAAVRADLAVDGYVYRFAPDERPLGEAEGAFLLCGFLMALADHHQGNIVEAFRWFERTRAACGTPGLLAEEWDVNQRQLRGNLPQAFVHAALLEAAVVLGR